MDPDVVLTIAFVAYAVVAAIGIGFLIAHNHRDSGMDDDAAHLGGTRLPREAYRSAERAPAAAWSRCTARHHAFRFGVAAYGFQFHPEVRAEDLGRWSTVPGYRRLLTENDGDWNGLTAALEQVTPELDRFANELLRRWLHLAAAIKTLRERPRLAA